MISIDENYIATLAPNANAVKNSLKLVESGKYPTLCITDDKQVVFGQCKGSGASVYDCSVDFANAAKPVPRCSCPSRQFPCKHCLGLLYAFVRMPRQFCEKELPQDVAGKRERAVKAAATRAERAKNPPAPKKVNLKALKKKLQTQLDALELLQNLLTDMLNRGLGNHGQKAARDLRNEAEMLRAAYLPGAELALLRLSSIVSGASQARNNGQDGEQGFFQAMDELARLEALIRRGKTYLQARISDPELTAETETAIAAWLGHAWQYTELQAAGLGEAASEFIQLAFFVHDDSIKQEFADTGIWLDLTGQRLFYTETLRPYKAVKYVKSEDSYFAVAKVPDFVRYPNESLQRVRWQQFEQRDATAADYHTIRAAAEHDFSALLKRLRADLKRPLRSRYQLAILQPVNIGCIDGKHYAIEDAQGSRIVLGNPTDNFNGVPATCQFMPLLGKSINDASLLCCFHLDMQTLQLTAQPLTFIHDDGLTRLAC